MSFIAKSVILDIADNWGDASHQLIRSVDFYLGDVLVSLGDTDMVCYSTTQYDAAQAASRAFITSLSKVGTLVNTSWESSVGAVANQRVIAVFNSEIEFDEIKVNNGHHIGAVTNRGVQNVKINISSDAITSTVYDEAITNSTQLFDGVFNEHVATDTIDDQVVVSGAGMVSGEVTEIGVPVARTVRIYTRSTGALVGTTTSDAVTGEYSFVVDPGDYFVIAFDDDVDPVYNAVILDKITII